MYEETIQMSWLNEALVAVEETLTVEQHALVGVVVVLLRHLLPTMWVPLPQLLIVHLLDLFKKQRATESMNRQPVSKHTQGFRGFKLLQETRKAKDPVLPLQCCICWKLPPRDHRLCARESCSASIYNDDAHAHTRTHNTHARTHRWHYAILKVCIHAGFWEKKTKKTTETG